MPTTWLDLDTERLIHSIKTATACIIGFWVQDWLGFSGSPWVVITIIVVMCAQIYVGGVLLKSYLRFLGTLVGCLFASFTLITAGPTPIAIVLTIAFSSFIFSYIATANENLLYAGTLGAATTAIILLGVHPTLSIAAHRFLEISTGILIASVVSQFFLPIHARTHLKRNQATTLSKLRDYYIASIIIGETEATAPLLDEDDENIVKLLIKQRQLAKNAARELFGATFDPKVFIQSLRCEKELFRAIIFMHLALTKIENTNVLLESSSILKTFNESVVASLNLLIAAVESDKTISDTMTIPSLTTLKESLLQKKTQAPEDLVYIDGFLFSAEILSNSLARLANLYNIALH